MNGPVTHTSPHSLPLLLNNTTSYVFYAIIYVCVWYIINDSNVYNKYDVEQFLHHTTGQEQCVVRGMKTGLLQQSNNSLKRGS